MILRHRCLNMRLSKIKKDDVDDLAEKIEQWLNYQQNKERSLIAKECYKIMDDKYNPHYQIKVLREVLNLV